MKGTRHVRIQLPLLAAAQPRRARSRGTSGAPSLRACAARGQAGAARHLRRLVPLVPRHGRDVVLRRRGDPADQRALRRRPRRQRPAARHQRPLQHGRLADDGVPDARRRGDGRHDVHPAGPDARRARTGQHVLQGQQGHRSSRRSPRSSPTASARGRRRPTRRRRLSRPDPARRAALARRRVRPGVRRLRQRAEVPAHRRHRPAAARVPARRRPRRAAHGAQDARAHVQGRHLRPGVGRLLPLLHEARLERPALREDARGQRAPPPRPAEALPRSARTTSTAATSTSRSSISTRG